MPRTPRSDSDLIAMSEKLAYEIEMLVWTARAAAASSPPHGGDNIKLATHNAHVESFLIHARNLIAFLWPPDKPKPDDVISEDFIDDRLAWTQNRPGKTKSLQGYQNAINKRLAHITYKKLEVTAETKGWPFGEIAAEIQSALKLFVPLVPASRLGPRFQEVVSQL